MAAFLIPCLLASPLFINVASASPVARLAPRDTSTVAPSFASATPIVIDHGSLDDAGIASMLKSLDSAAPAATPAIRRRQDDTATSSSLALAVTTAGPFVRIDVGDPLVACLPSQVSTVTAPGPIQTLQFFTGSSDMRSLKLSSINGSVTEVTSTIGKGDDAGSFTFDSNEKVTEMYVRVSERQFTGFNFTTGAGNTYKAITSVGENIAAQKVPVGSGILAQIRYVYCPNGVIASMGFDFLDDLQSIAISNISYAGFTNNILPATDGQTVTVGSQIIDNRNSSSDQSTSIQTTAAVTKQHSLTTTIGWNVGNTVTVTGKVGIPFLTEGSVSTAATWGLQGSTASQNLDGSTITNAGTVNLKCPAQKYCVGSSFFTMFKIDVDVEATFEATTKAGASYHWVQKGSYSGADSLAIELRVDEVNGTVSKRMATEVPGTVLF